MAKDALIQGLHSFGSVNGIDGAITTVWHAGPAGRLLPAVREEDRRRHEGRDVAARREAVHGPRTHLASSSSATGSRSKAAEGDGHRADRIGGSHLA